MILQMAEPSTSQRYHECSLSKRECEVLRLVAHEYSSKEIARKLFISDYTVIAHRQNMMEKLGVKNTAGLVRVGFEKGFLQLHNTLTL